MLTRKLLAAYLALAVDPPDDPDPAPPASAEPPDDELPDLEAPDEPDPAPSGSGDPPDDPDAVHQRALAAATARAEKAEKAEREAAERLAAAERARTAAPPGPSQEQQLFEQEEQRLRDPAITATEKWQIESNRVLRSTQRETREALWNSREQADKTEYARLCAEKPLAKKYEKRVEEKLAEMRKGGFNIERKLVLKMIIGDDIVEGKVKTGKKAAAGGGDPPVTRVERGRQPVVRSDVRGRGTPSEHDKRKARLENQII